MPVLKKQKGQMSIGELQQKIENGTASQKEQKQFRNLEEAIQPLLNLINKVESYGKNLKESPGVRVWRIVRKGDSKCIAGLKWRKLSRKLEVSLDIEGEDKRILPNEMLSEFTHVEIPKSLPINRAPGFVFRKLDNCLQQRLKENYKHRRSLLSMENLDMDYEYKTYASPEQALGPKLWDSQTQQDVGYYKNKKAKPYSPYLIHNSREYMLIDEIAESFYITSQTLRNWEKKGLISFERIPRKTSQGERQLRAIQIENLPPFLNRLSEIKAMMNSPKKIKVPVGYLPTEEACKKLGKCRRTLQRWAKAGKIPQPLKKQGRCFYKIT